MYFLFFLYFKNEQISASFLSPKISSIRESDKFFLVREFVTLLHKPRIHYTEEGRIMKMSCLMQEYIFLGKKSTSRNLLVILQWKWWVWQLYLCFSFIFWSVVYISRFLLHISNIINITYLLSSMVQQASLQDIRSSVVCRPH